jgi:hypothetical protein
MQIGPNLNLDISGCIPMGYGLEDPGFILGGARLLIYS